MSTQNIPFQLGDRVRDVITGFKGVVTGRIEYINGCDQCCISPEATRDGKLAESIWFDWQRLERSGKAVVMPQREGGGPQLGSPGRQA